MLTQNAAMSQFEVGAALVAAPNERTGPRTGGHKGRPYARQYQELDNLPCELL
jgi:hypothetical protein